MKNCGISQKKGIFGLEVDKVSFQQVQNEDQNSSKLEGTVLDFGSDTEEEEEEEDLDITFIEE